MNSTQTLSTVTRRENGDGTYRYERNGKTLAACSGVLYTHFAEFEPTSYEFGPLTMHKTEAAAMRTKGASGAGHYYWTKMGYAAIEVVE